MCMTGNDHKYATKINNKKCSATGNRTPVSRVTGGDTHHYTIVELINMHKFAIYNMTSA